ncbi:MAG TPA: MerR family transcriptional regulator [Candidatus Limnocylindrales bacterium]|nr:MerR family transcriptional regulator [Candidatus Limnocylindrales bacterium]
MASTYSIGEAARATGLSVHTLRYYERIGLIEPVGRLPNGRRAYSEDDLWWLGFVGLLATTGMPIRDLLAFVRLERAGDVTLDDRRAMLLRQQRSLQRGIERLTQYLEAVEQKLAHYGGPARR